MVVEDDPPPELQPLWYEELDDELELYDDDPLELDEYP
jgi:hypothetical protein